MAEPAQPPLRGLTYLSPGIPLEFFELVVRHLGRALGRAPFLESDARVSGPMHGDHDPFAAGQADLGFVCSPSYLYLRSLPQPSVELVPVGFVFGDPRNRGLPHYFSDVIVRADRGCAALEDLRGGVFGFNDPCSLSGYFAARQELACCAPGDGFFAREVCTGSHAASIAAVLAGEVDAAAIDSNVLALAARGRPHLRDRLRVVASWGPYPIQPIVLGSRLFGELGARVSAALLDMPADPEAGPALRRFGLERCVPIDDALYAEERAALERLGQLRLRRS